MADTFKQSLVAAAAIALGIALTPAFGADPQADRGKDHAGPDCNKFTGKEYDKCIQATPAGPVNMETGEKNKQKSEVVRERNAEAAAEGEPVPQKPQDQPVGDPQAPVTPGKQPGETR
jgi:hypothetical protein